MISNAPATIAVIPISLTLMTVANTTSLSAKNPAAINTMPRSAQTQSEGRLAVLAVDLLSMVVMPSSGIDKIFGSNEMVAATL
jgi:hypothetical protein